MPGPYLIGIDGGTQSTKVVVVDAEGHVVAEGREPLRPTSRPKHGVVFHPDDDLWDSLAAASRQALAALRRRSGRDRGRRPLHDPLLQGVPQSGRIARRAGDQLDGRPRLPALPARRPGPRVRDHLLGVSRPPPHRRVPRLGREQHPPAVADRRRQMGLERRRCAVRAVPAAARAALRAPAAR